MERGKREIPCPSNNEGCKYAPNCFLSEHHLYPQRNAENRLQRAFGNLAVNRVVSCRRIHDILDTFPAPDYPSEETMLNVYEQETGKKFKHG